MSPGPRRTPPFRKQRRGAGTQYYHIEAAGLAWLNVHGGPPVPQVLHVGADHLMLQRLAPATPTVGTFEDFGRRLATMHRAGAETFGHPPAGVTEASGYIADLPLPYGPWPDFGAFYAEARILPYVRTLTDAGSASSGELAVFEHLMAALVDPASGIGGPAEPVSRIHGDLWSGNVMWCPTSPGGPVTGWLIDPAAHGGHRETDLAMLALFGLPGLESVITGYEQVSPLAAGWRKRVPLHQVHPLLVHAVLFGGSYLAQARAAASAAMRTA